MLPDVTESVGQRRDEGTSTISTAASLSATELVVFLAVGPPWPPLEALPIKASPMALRVSREYLIVENDKKKK